MEIPKQLSFFAVDSDSYSGRELGTFKDSMRAPVYRWFRYPAGYSYKFVQESFDIFNVKPGQWIYDPFSGSGTTLLCAKHNNINGYGVEAHSFVHWVAKVKLYWEFDRSAFTSEVHQFLNSLSSLEDVETKDVFPELVYKCYHPQDLKVLLAIRYRIEALSYNPHLQDFLKLALTDTLRSAALAGTGWPYIAPNKNKGDHPPKDALKQFHITVNLMHQDLQQVTESHSLIYNVLGDSRETQNLENEQVQLALTSPPYLNNYDYADRTRLETYFWGLTKSWSEITAQYRNKLIVAATTQIRRNEHDIDTVLSDEIKQLDAKIYNTLQKSILDLYKRRQEKGGKKDYDLMVALYFNDILSVMRETYRVTANGGHFCLVLGDSAPYGVHIATDYLIGQLGVALGFNTYQYHELRERGNKWKNNPQRHQVSLREGIVILKK